MSLKSNQNYDSFFGSEKRRFLINFYILGNTTMLTRLTFSYWLSVFKVLWDTTHLPFVSNFIPNERLE